MSISFLTAQSQLLTTLRKEASENISGKGENAGNHYFLKIFSILLEKNFNFKVTFILLSAKAFNLSFGTGLTLYQMTKFWI